ncbi:MAG: TetR/AcrR family transcriptional regulator [Bacteroidales bacterium]|nr:TetR/AcrR family transcriptional regulator [Bacteroidales bacterium]
MVNQQKDTEGKILDAAKEVFQQKGMTGARMQEIADKAGINKALLHYYYRTKEKLFEKVFNIAFSIFIPRMQKIMLSEKPVLAKIEYFIENYVDLLTKHPYIPGFVINELNRNPQILVNIFEKNIHIKENKLFEKFDTQIQAEVQKGIIKPIDTRNLMTNVIALCVFPIVARPIIQGIMFDNDKKQYDAFLKQRKDFVKEFIINSIKM